MFISGFLLFSLMSFSHCNEAVEDYIALSMELTGLFKDMTEVTETEIHDLSKDVIAHGDNQRRLKKIYDTFLEGKSQDFQTLFRETFLNPRMAAHVTDRLEKILGYYLTKYQIDRFRVILVQQFAAKASPKDIIAAIKTELTKDLGAERAGIATDMVVNDLRVLYQLHGDLVQQADTPLAYLARDEL